MKCSFVASTFNRPPILRGLLASLQAQRERDFEVIVADNSSDLRARLGNQEVIKQLEDQRFSYLFVGAAQCYEAANLVVPLTKGDHLCFPSDDGYYAPAFLSTLLARSEDLVFCDCVYDERSTDRMTQPTKYRVINVVPKLGTIDKGGFVVRRDRWVEFPWKENVTGADGLAIERLMKARISHYKVEAPLWVHN